MRTVLCMQLSPKMRERDLREFMSSVGLVRHVRVIADPRTKKCKGVAYVEFKAPESVALAIGLTGQKLLGIPIQVSEGVVVLVRELQVLLPRYSDKSNQGRLGGGRTSNNIHRDHRPTNGPKETYIIAFPRLSDEAVRCVNMRKVF